MTRTESGIIASYSIWHEYTHSQACARMFVCHMTRMFPPTYHDRSIDYY